jgi:hypothetical protein
MTTTFEPYVGPRPFEQTEADRTRFFGRTNEASELMSCVIAHSAILIYSPSGAGKTSLINAKLVPLLEDAGFQVLKPTRVRDVPPSEQVRDKIANIYIFNVLRSWESKATPELLAPISLSQYLNSRTSVDEEGDPKPRVVIFDQFEELFTSYQERAADRENFFGQVGTALTQDHLLRVVFAMREDYIAELDPYLPLLPEKLRTRYRIERLSEQDAKLAIVEPLRGSEYSYADGVAEQLVEDLLMVPVETANGAERVRGDSVEPVQLQVVCQNLWHNCQASWKASANGPRIITRKYLEEFGDVDQALSDFYEKAIKGVTTRASVREGTLRRWFEEHLITSAGTRGTVFRGPKETGNIPNDAVDELVNQHIIRGELRGGSRWYELTHDRFIAPIKTSNERWFRERSGGVQLPKQLETRAHDWSRGGRQKKDLMQDEGELLVAERWLENAAAADVPYSDTLFGFVQASRSARNEEKVRSARRLKSLAMALLVLVILLGLALFVAFRGQQAARRSERAATENQKKADEERIKAETSRKVAEDQKTKADDLAEKFRRAQEVADQQKTIAQNNERIAKREKAQAVRLAGAEKDLLDQTRNAEDNHRFALRESRDECDKRQQLQTNLRTFEDIKSGYETLGNAAQAAAMAKRIEEIRSEYNALTCTKPD